MQIKPLCFPGVRGNYPEAKGACLPIHTTHKLSNHFQISSLMGALARAGARRRSVHCPVVLPCAGEAGVVPNGRKPDGAGFMPSMLVAERAGMHPATLDVSQTAAIVAQMKGVRRVMGMSIEDAQIFARDKDKGSATLSLASVIEKVSAATVASFQYRGLKLYHGTVTTGEVLYCPVGMLMVTEVCNNEPSECIRAGLMPVNAEALASFKAIAQFMKLPGLNEADRQRQELQDALAALVEE